MKTFRRLAEVFSIGLLVCISAIGRSAEAPPSADRPHISQLGPGDPISVQISGQADATNVFVGDDGMINLPLVGAIPVAGLSVVEAGARVAKALKDGGYFVDPIVTIVTQPRSQVVTVLGEVHTPGRFPVTPGTTILDMLAQAGGVKETASDVGYVQRRDESGHINRYPVNLNGLTDLKDTLPTSSLMGGDSLVVPPAGSYFVNGEVTTPGKFYIEPGMTVMQAIVHAGGITERGSEHRIELKRLGKDGQYKILHPKPGDPIEPGDVIRVKESLF
ncbi:MAG: polysaccharide biosynthesis/export family protein [Steroidobacteraceae bacterium]